MARNISAEIRCCELIVNMYNSSKDDDVFEVTELLYNTLIIIFISVDIFPEDNNNIFYISNNFISESLHKKCTCLPT